MTSQIEHLSLLQCLKMQARQITFLLRHFAKMRNQKSHVYCKKNNEDRFGTRFGFCLQQVSYQYFFKNIFKNVYSKPKNQYFPEKEFYRRSVSQNTKIRFVHF